ncbi:APC family permease [Aurantiacibacter gilvus]|uniref:Amino acid permease n=1 Tax=Aurantiacibacter gilvus TaxID=3139141 RepID=A0ABU9IF04_9SPHN
MALKRSMGLAGLTFFGTGTILGAGIFVVIGEVVGSAGVLAPLAYLAAGLVALTTALSFAELGARIPDAGGPVAYAEEAFGNALVEEGTGWLLIVANIVSAATIVTGFVAYLSSFVTVPIAPATSALVVLMVAVALIGIKHSAWFMTATTLVGIATLLFILFVLREDLFAAPARIVTGEGLGADAATGILAGAFLALYSFIGFGDMAETAEEVKDVRRNLPRAVMISLAIVFAFYLAVSMALVGGTSLDEVTAAEAPLVAAVAAKGWPGMPVAIASLFVIVNGALAQIVAASRLMMDMARDGKESMPARLQAVSKDRGTPWIATLVCGAIVLVLALFIPLRSLASGTSLAILVVFAVTNAALWRLKQRSQPDQVPDVWRVVPALGFVFCLFTIVGQVVLWLLGIGGSGGH